jgi:hypothetical protein
MVRRVCICMCLQVNGDLFLSRPSTLLCGDTQIRTNEMAKKFTQLPRKSASNKSKSGKRPTRTRARVDKRKSDPTDDQTKKWPRPNENSDMEAVEEQQEGEQQQEKRGRRRISAAQRRNTTKDLINSNASFAVRRILAERMPSGSRKRQYLIDWLPSWENASCLQEKTEQVRTWKKSKKDNHTFNFNGEVVYRCSNPTEDKHDVVARTMVDTVLDKFKEWMTIEPEILSKLLFVNHDWVFASLHYQVQAEKQAAIVGLARPSTAAEVLREAYLQMRELDTADFDDERPTYRGVKVRYIGQIDKDYDEEADPTMRPPIEVTLTLAPLFHSSILNMDPDNWETTGELNDNMVPLKELGRLFTMVSPYVLRHPWPHMFTRLFWLSDRMIPRLKAGHEIKVTDEWGNRSRDFFLHTYASECGEQRPIDCVEQTYLAARDMCRWHAKFRSAEEDPEMEEKDLADKVINESEDEELEETKDDK